MGSYGIRSVFVPCAMASLVGCSSVLGIDGLVADRDEGGSDAGACSSGPIARIQTTRANTLTTSSNTIVATLTGSALPGDYLVVGVNYIGCGGVAGIADTQGNDYERIVAPDTLGKAGTLETWGAKSIGGAAGDSVAVTFETACMAKNVKVIDYRGVDAAAPVAGNVSMHGGASAPTAEIATPSNGLVFAHTADSAMAAKEGDGWTLVFEDEWYTIAEERTASAGESYTATFYPDPNEDWVIQAVALRCE